MTSKTINALRLITPLSKAQKERVLEMEKYLIPVEIKTLKRLLKLKKVGFSYTSLKVSKELLQNTDYPKLHLNLREVKDNEIKRFIEEINKKIEYSAKEAMFKRFSVKADKVIPKLIAPHITGMEPIKEAATLQLFSKEKIHILLLGDPGTGKTEILRSSTNMAPISSFGIGSGTSNAGLSLAMKGNEVIPGLLPLANNGICCIDELNLMKQQDRASLYSAMEKGIVSYDKANKHVTLDANVNILATANPKGDKFAGWMINTLRKQIPFESALLSRFHLLFLIRTPNVKQFEEIAKKIVDNHPFKQNKDDLSFIKDYIDFLEDFEVKFPKELQNEIVEFSKKLKTKESEFLIEVSPRVVHGLLRLAKASAKMNMRPQVMISDIAKVKQIFEDSLNIKR